MIPLLAASEKGTGQTESASEKKLEMWWELVTKLSRGSSLERDTLEGDSPVLKDNMSLLKRVGLPRLDVWIRPDWRPTLNISPSPIVNLVPRGKAEKYS